MIHCTFENGAKASLRHVVTDAIVIKNDKILLVKRSPQLVEGNKWALIGGFVERDEILKNTVAREVPEETGYNVSDITLFTIRDNPIRHENRQNISIVFICKGGKKIGEPDWETTDVKWFTFDKLPKKEEFAFDHYEILMLYKQYKEKQLTLPIIE